ncbi:hypothetical protein JHK87_004399 [Glycine soja]|nr:hypothetical protein JHK87_004399 [Glycine soja]
MPSPFPAIANLPTDEDGPNMAMEELPPPHNDLPLVTLINRVLRQRLSLCPLDNNLVNLALHEERFQKIIRNFFSRFKAKKIGHLKMVDVCTQVVLLACRITTFAWFKMYSLADASGHRTTLMALRNSMYLIPLGFLAYDYRSNIVTWKFAATDLECKVHIVQTGVVQPLIEMLQSPDAGIAHNGGLVPLLKLLDSKNGPLQHNAAFALYGLADNEDNASDFIRVGGIQRLQDGEFIVLATIDCVAKSLKRLEKNIHDRALRYAKVWGRDVVRSLTLVYTKRLFPDSNP